MHWWMWALAGLILLGAELMTPGGFFMLFFGLAALAEALLVGLGAGGPLWAQIACFSVLSVISLLGFRKKLMDRFKPPAGMELGMADVVGGIVLAQGDIAPGAVGKAEFRGTIWQVRNSGAAAIAKDIRCRIGKVEGLMLHISPE